MGGVYELLLWEYIHIGNYTGLAICKQNLFLKDLVNFLELRLQILSGM